MSFIISLGALGTVAMCAMALWYRSKYHDSAAALERSAESVLVWKRSYEQSQAALATSKQDAEYLRSELKTLEEQLQHAGVNLPDLVRARLRRMLS